MTERQKTLIRAFARTDSITAAAAEALYTTKHIRKTLQKLLDSDQGKAIYEAERDKQCRQVSALTEPAYTAALTSVFSTIEQYFTSVMNGKAPDSLDHVSVAQRTRAAENLAKLNGLYKTPPEPAEDAQVLFHGEQDLTD